MIDAREKFGQPIDYVNLYAKEKFSHVTYTEGNKMTRQEAIKKCLAAFGGQKVQLGDVNVFQLLSCIEALGLIKFEEERESMLVGDKMGDNHEVRVDFAIKQLEARGYQIVNIGKNTSVTLEACVEVAHTNPGRIMNGKLIKIEQ